MDDFKGISILRRLKYQQYFFCINSLKSPTLLGYSWYNISKKTNKEVRNLDEKEMKDTVENIFEIELEDDAKEKTIEDEIKEILDIKGE